MTAPLPQAEKERAVPPDFPLGRIVRFGSLVSTVLLSANALVCATWSYFFDLPGWMVWQIVPGALAIAFIPATILRFRSSHPALRIIYALSASWLGALNFAFFASVACWIGEGVIWTTAWPLSRSSSAAVLFSLALIATVYGLINAACLRTTLVTVKLPNLPEAWQGHTAALVTDLHLGPLSGPDFLRRVLARLRLLKPDAVFISGDMFDGPTLGLDALVAPWSEFSAPRGVFYVTGNHDEFAERSLYLEPVRRVGIRVLNNEMTLVDGLQIIGIHDSESGNPTELRSILRQVQIHPMQPSILLAHRPINLSIAEEEGVSLQLSGHTHGGQIWPWNLLVSQIYGRFAHGLDRLGKLQVYTSYGVGTWGPPLRVGTKSEIVLIRFENEIV
jgi:uncharacterized protein